MQLTKKVIVTIESTELVELLISALHSKAEVSDGKEYTLLRAFSCLVGCSDVEAVRMANKIADEKEKPHVKVSEFRRWLPQILAETFAEFMANK